MSYLDLSVYEAESSPCLCRRSWRLWRTQGCGSKEWRHQHLDIFLSRLHNTILLDICLPRYIYEADRVCAGALGVSGELKAAGAKSGDTIMVGNVDFKYYEESSMAVRARLAGYGDPDDVIGEMGEVRIYIYLFVFFF